MRRRVFNIAGLGVFLLVLGCEPTLKDKELSKEELRQQIGQLQEEVVKAHKEYEKLQEEIAILRSFPADRLKHLVQVVEVEFGRFTRTYDEDEDGSDDGVVVYLVLHDQQGDKIKAAGEVQIELWDLAAEGGEQLLKKEYSMEELKSYWLSGFLTDHFKIQLPWAEGKRPQHSHLTLKLHFKDALTGKRFELQKLLEVVIK